VTVRPEVVLARLAQLARALAQIGRLTALTRQERARDPVNQFALERALHVAAEAIFDIGHHVLAGRGLGVPAQYRDILPALAAAGVISRESAARTEGLAGLRNLIVHDYADLDPERLWQLAETRLEDLRTLHAELSRLPELGRAR